jgi:hypothetical protein
MNLINTIHCASKNQDLYMTKTYVRRDGAVAIVDRVNLFVVGSSVAPKGEFINSELFLLVVGRQK